MFEILDIWDILCPTMVYHKSSLETCHKLNFILSYRLIDPLKFKAGERRDNRGERRYARYNQV
jgi:hypothetical protein